MSRCQSRAAQLICIRSGDWRSGSAAPLHGDGRGFESLIAHHSDLTVELLLPQRLEQNQRRAVGQIQRTRGRIEHRNPQPVFPVGFEKLFRQARRLAPEDKVIIRTKLHFVVTLRAIGFDKPQPRAGCKFVCKRGPVRPAMPLDLLPVIHARAFELRVVQLEAERLNEVQRRPRSRAEPRDVARVRRDFRFDENDVLDVRL